MQFLASTFVRKNRRYVARTLRKLYYARVNCFLLIATAVQVFGIWFMAWCYGQPFMGQSVYVYTYKSRLNQQPGSIMALCFMLLIKWFIVNSWPSGQVGTESEARCSIIHNWRCYVCAENAAPGIQLVLHSVIITSSFLNSDWTETHRNIFLASYGLYFFLRSAVSPLATSSPSFCSSAKTKKQIT